MFSGREAGDLFETEESAAIDFAMIYNVKSIKEGVEYGAFIYSYQEQQYKNGNATTVVYYSYGKPVKGKSDSVNTSDFSKVPGNTTAIIHTHGRFNLYTSTETFSSKDTEAAMLYNVDIYLATPNGYLKKQDIKTKTFTVKYISSNIPFDLKNPFNYKRFVIGGVNHE